MYLSDIWDIFLSYVMSVSFDLKRILYKIYKCLKYTNAINVIKHTKDNLN